MYIKLTINGKEVSGKPGQTILNVANENRIEIPTLCHDDRVKEYGACGICVVEIEGNPRLIRACATTISEGMNIQTLNERIIEARRFALELLMSDHRGDCRPPCTLGCPAQTDCQGYVGLIANGKFKEASALIKEVIPLPASIGRICPHPCEDACRRELVEEPISIAALKAVIGDYDLANGEAYKPQIQPDTGKKIAIVGGGPAGLTCAYHLRKRGHYVMIYDRMPKMGGMLRYGIPEYRLPKALLDKEINLLSEMGIDMLNGTHIGKGIALKRLTYTYSAVVIAAGAWKSTGMSCPGDDLNGIYGGIYFLTDIALGKPVHLGKKVAVVGGGNTAMDACRSALRLGAEEVYIVYRRTRAEMPAEEIEIKEAEEEGVIFKFLTNPIEILGDDDRNVKGIRLQKMELGAPDKSGRRSPVPIEGAEEILEVDNVIMAIGQGTDLDGFEELAVTRWNTIIADEKTYETNLPYVFAIGDATNNGAGIAIEAIAEGKKVADVIDEALRARKVKAIPSQHYVTDEKVKEDFADKPIIKREQMSHTDPTIRSKNFDVITDGLSLEQAVKEASRCLECGCADVYECKLLKYASEYEANHLRFAGEKNTCPTENRNYFYRNMEKCILCGLCVRICEEVVGRTAIGFSGRGFETLAEASPLESDCINCGQCVSVCPTGAITERLPMEKEIPLAEEKFKTTCVFCGVGCKVNLATAVGTLMRSLPAEPDTLLCIRGRFGMVEMANEERITTPYIRRDGELVPCTYEDAYDYVADKVKELRAVIENTVCFAISDRYTIEEMHLIKELSACFGRKKAFSFNGIKSGIADVMRGRDESTCSYDDLDKADVIMLICHDIMTSHPVAGMKIKKAVDKGAELVLISDKVSQADEWATTKSDLTEESLLHNELFNRARNAVIVFDQKAVSYSTAQMIANLSVSTGHHGKPGNGIIQLKQNCNSQGIAKLGIITDIEKIIHDIERTYYRAVFVFGEDVTNADLTIPELLVVHDTYMTDTAKKAHVVFPATAYTESEGTYLDSVGNENPVKPAFKPSVKNTYDLIFELSEALGYPLERRNPIKLYREVFGFYYGFEETPKDWCMTIPKEAPRFVDYHNTNSLYNRLIARHEGLKPHAEACHED